MSVRFVPRVTVVMPVYNAAPYVRAAVESVVNQDFTDWELLAVDDGSSDGSLGELERFQDPRIRILTSESNRGNVCARNRAIVEARGELIALHDADDVSDPRRLGWQVRFLSQHPAYGVVGTCFWRMDASGVVYRRTSMPRSDIAICQAMLLSNPIANGSVMIRRNLLRWLGGYHDAFPAEDYDLWMRAAQVSLIANLPEALYSWRIHDESVSRTHAAEQVCTANAVRERMKERWLAEEIAENGWQNDPGVPDSVRRYARTRARVCAGAAHRRVLRRSLFVARLTWPALAAGESPRLLGSDVGRVTRALVNRRLGF